MSTIDELLKEKIESIAKKSADRVTEIFKEEPIRGKLFVSVFQGNFEHMISTMRKTLGPKETQEILELYIAVNKEIDEVAQKLFTH